MTRAGRFIRWLNAHPLLTLIGALAFMLAVAYLLAVTLPCTFGEASLGVGMAVLKARAW